MTKLLTKNMKICSFLLTIESPQILLLINLATSLVEAIFQGLATVMRGKVDINFSMVMTRKSKKKNIL